MAIKSTKEIHDFIGILQRWGVPIKQENEGLGVLSFAIRDDNGKPSFQIIVEYVPHHSSTNWEEKIRLTFAICKDFENWLEIPFLLDLEDE